MRIPAEQAEAAAFLARLTGCDRPIETHISAVFLGADRVLKLKKAVDLGFLDFTTPEARGRFCRRELELNAPHAPEIYRGVHALTRGPDGAVRLEPDGAVRLEPDGAVRLEPDGAARLEPDGAARLEPDGAARPGGEGEVLDWVVEMAPLPADDFLDAVAARGGLDPALLDALGDSVAAMHASAVAHPEMDPLPLIRRVLEGNLAAAHAAGLPPEPVEALGAALRESLDRLTPVLRERSAAGRLRRCHGDLHLANLVLVGGRPVPFDALEFDEAMATIDTGYDLAFLLMDLELRLGRASANRVLSRYVARAGDAGQVAGLPFWLPMRALIRSHCEARAGRDGLRFLEAAGSLSRPSPPLILAVGGVMGTGKTRLARRLAPGLGRAPGALHLRSDEIRKRLAGIAPEERLPPEAYDRAAGLATHAEMFRMAETAAAAGQAVVVDAVFLDPALRASIEASARRAGVPFVGFWLQAGEAVLAARIAARRGDASDADEAVMRRALATDPGDLRGWVRIDATGDPEPAALAQLGPFMPPAA